MSYYCIFQYKYTYTFLFLKRVQSTEPQKTLELLKSPLHEVNLSYCGVLSQLVFLVGRRESWIFVFLDEHIYQVKARLIMDEQMFSRELLAKCIAIHSWALPSSLAYRIVYTQQESNMESWTVVVHCQVSILYHEAVF